MADGRWHDVAITWDHRSGEVTLYIDGKEDTKAVLRPKAKQNDQLVRLGFGASDFPRPKSYFDGEIASIQFFAEKLPASLIASGVGTAQPVGDWNFAAAKNGTVKNLAADRHHAAVWQGKPASEAASRSLVAGVKGEPADLKWSNHSGALRLTVPEGDQPLSFTLWFATIDSAADASDGPANGRRIDGWRRI